MNVANVRIAILIFMFQKRGLASVILVLLAHGLNNPCARPATRARIDAGGVRSKKTSAYRQRVRVPFGTDV